MKLALAFGLFLQLACADKHAPHHAHSSAFLANRQPTTAGDDMKMVRELEFAERAVDAQLQKDHAPMELRKIEQSFLRQAESDISRGQRYEPQNASISTKTGYAHDSHASFQDGMHHIINVERAAAKDVKFVEGKTVQALREAYASAAEEAKVEGFFDKVVDVEKDQMSMARRALMEPYQTLAHKPQVQRVAVVKFELEAPVENTNMPEDELSKLQAENNQLVAENEQMRNEHNKLVEEMQVKEENKEIRMQNAALQIENDELSSILA